MPSSPDVAAVRAGIFQQNGLNVDAQHIAEGVTGMQALIAGSTVMGELGGSLMLGAAAQGADVVMIANLENRYPYHIMGAKGMQSVEDLKGKTIGVTSPGSTDDTALRAAVAAQGLTDQDVQFLTIGAEDARVAALVNGTIQATAATPAAYLQLQGQGFPSILDIATQNVPAATAGIVVMRPWMEAHKDVVQRYMDSLVTATALEKSNKTFVEDMLRGTLGITDQTVLDATYQNYVVESQPALPYPTQADLQAVVMQMAPQNPQVTSVDLNTVLDPEFVQSAADRGLDRSS